MCDTCGLELVHAPTLPLPASNDISTGASVGSVEGASHECYICCGGYECGELRSVCVCRGRLLHIDCELQVIQTCPSHGLRCPVCNIRYSNITCRSARFRAHLTEVGRTLSAVLLASGTLFGLGLHQLLHFSRRRQSLNLVFGLAFISLAFLSTLLVRLVATRQPCLIHRSWVTLYGGNGNAVKTVLWPPIKMTAPRTRPLPLGRTRWRGSRFNPMQRLQADDDAVLAEPSRTASELT